MMWSFFFFFFQGHKKRKQFYYILDKETRHWNVELVFGYEQQHKNKMNILKLKN